MSSIFGGGKKKPTEEVRKSGDAPPALSIVAQGAVVIGDVVSVGDIRVEGTIDGKLVCKSKLVVGNKGKITGEVDALNATVGGEIHGTLTVRDTLQLLETAKIFGDIITEKIVINQGAVFTGRCKMGKEAHDMLKSTPIPDLLAANRTKKDSVPKLETLRIE